MPKDRNKTSNSDEDILDDQDEIQETQNSLSESVEKMSLSFNGEEEAEESKPRLIVDDDEEVQEFVSRGLPVCNCKEKIIIVIDTAKSEMFTSFKTTTKTDFEPIIVIKRALEIFLSLKSSMDSKHEYALVELRENSAEWILDFTSNIHRVIENLHDIGECAAEDIFNLDTLFNVIKENVKLPPKPEENEMVGPPYVVRTILIYNRSYTVPEFSEEIVKEIVEHPFFTLDCLMTHEPPDATNNCEKIFKVLETIDKKGLAYFFPVSRDIGSLYQSMAKLLGHPLQRPPQSYAKYDLKDSNI